MFNVVTGLYPPDEGDVRFRGDSIVGLAPNRITRLGISRTFQTVHLFANMTVLENAMVGQHCRSRSGVFGSILRLPGTRREEREIRERAQNSRRSCSPTQTAAAWRWREPWRPTPCSSAWTNRRPG
jgi:branched-chain amino acid transport system ATP-binding protein